MSEEVPETVPEPPDPLDSDEGQDRVQTENPDKDKHPED